MPRKKRMTKDELIAKLIELQSNGDEEAAHWDADEALIEFIHDDRVKEAFYGIGKWYA